ncbi:MAG: formate dehydrogenase accessory sulfurtransferase FdhD [Balneolales bacterium]
MIKAMPQVSIATIKRFKATTQEMVKDLLAVEEPLHIRLQFGHADSWHEESLTVTMRTPGNDFELTKGFLLAENVINDSQDILFIRYCQKVKEEEQGNVVIVKLAPHIYFDRNFLERHFFINSSCGICGKSAIEAVTCNDDALTVKHSQKISINLVHQLNYILEKKQTVFRHTGGLHASALFNLQGECLFLREDVGRHNAFDKVVGAALSSDMIPMNEALILLSGRVSFELVQKSVKAGIPIIVAVGAPSSLAVELADAKGITLIGFLRGNRCNIYTYPERILDK